MNNNSISHSADAVDDNFVIGYVIVNRELKFFKVAKGDIRKCNLDVNGIFDKVIKR